MATFSVTTWRIGWRLFRRGPLDLLALLQGLGLFEGEVELLLDGVGVLVAPRRDVTVEDGHRRPSPR